MKRNKMMRIASALMVATLLSTSVISGTFAKYVTTNKAEDTARVAKWGVTVDASGNLFGAQYVNGELAESVPTTSTTATGISVESKNNSDNVVAPGTKSENGLSFGIKGEPEVDAKVSMIVAAKDIYLAEGTYGVMQQVTVNETNFAELVNAGLYTEASSTYTKVGTGATYVAGTYYQLAYTAEVAEGGYYPVKYSWTGDTGATKMTKASDIAAAIAGKIVTGSTDGDTAIAGVKYTVVKTYESNTNLATIGLAEEKIGWEWEFGEAETEIGKAVLANSKDARDTILGDLMAEVSTVVAVKENEGTVEITVLDVDDDGFVTKGEDEVGCLKTAFDIKITVEQVD